MSSKKSKKKKHKKEERVSSSSHEEKKERDSKRFSSPKSHKHHHHHDKRENFDEAKRRTSTDAPSTRNISPSKARSTKTDTRQRRGKEEASSESKSRTVRLHITQEKEKVTDKRKHENVISGRNFSKHAETSSSSKELERQKLVSRKTAPEKPRAAQDDSPPQDLQDKRRKLLKRSLSPDLHADAKRRDTKDLSSTNLAHQGSQADVLKEMRKKLVSRRSKVFDQIVGAKSSHDKTVNDHFKETLVPVVKPVDFTKPKLPEDFSHKQLDKKQCFSPVPKISFKIPKKGSTVKAQTNIVHLGTSDSRTKCNSQSCLPETVMAGSSSTNSLFVSQKHRLKPQKVLVQTSNKLSSDRSQHPLHLSSAGAVQQVPTDKSRDVSTPSKTEPFQETYNAFTSAQEQRKENHLKTPQKPVETFDCDHEMQLVEELHLARSERRLELNLVENCGELTCMDIDPPEEGASVMLNEGQHQQSLLIVLDTNVLLSHLEFVKKIRSNGLGALGFPTLLIPWVVLQELDYLKSGKLSSKVEDKARPAVHYIYSCLKNQEPRLLGQSMQQASQAICGPGVVNNDDRVLDCCLQYQVFYPECALVLCTDDKNLCSKALLSGVKALSKADLVKEVEENRLTILNHLHAPSITALPVVPAEKGPECKVILFPRGSPAEKQLQGTRCNNAVDERQLSECVSVLESCLQGALSEVLEEEMKAAYGDLWTEIVYVKPPWSLEGILKCFKKHWIAVFGNIIRRSLLSCVEMLSDCLCSHRTIKHASVVSAVRGAGVLLSALAGRSQYSGRVDQALSTLHMLQQRLQSPKAPVESNDDDEDSLMAEIEEGEAPPSHACHQEVWALFESIWNNVCQISSSLFSVLHYSPGATEPSLQATEPPPQEALSCLLRLSTALKQLLEALQRVLSVDSSVQDAQLLLSFIQTSEIAAMEPQFTAKDLFDFVSQQEYRLRGLRGLFCLERASTPHRTENHFTEARLFSVQCLFRQVSAVVCGLVGNVLFPFSARCCITSLDKHQKTVL